MRIPLDYYRILGLPIQATADQLQQAHRDRTQQLPRREFSETAIDLRKQLIDEAFAVLSDPVQRQAYDTSFLAKSYELEVGKPSALYADAHSAIDADVEAEDAYTPSIEIQDAQFVGALLILLELGEYELVLKLGRPFLIGGTRTLRDGQYGDSELIAADIVLAVALACLELGREQWQQGQYENAAESLETGQKLLLRENLFPAMRGEMQTELFKLRPYRVLELLSLPESQGTLRSHGLSLLGDMLQERGGIDGAADDQSGLNVDDFLRFVQQIRSYLTAAEQQTLFEAEARRPSPVATYLAVYALLARGFAQRQPALVRRAKSMLMRLGTRQDVHLEQAVCALLLGQTEEASRALELSQEFESLNFIREHSQGSPDLLPGLCLYSERWLQNEVFPHFRDLVRKQASLKEYFADPDVQAYLEELPNEPELASPPPIAAFRSGTGPRQPATAPLRTSTADRSPVGTTATLTPPDAADFAELSGFSPNGRSANGSSPNGRSPRSPQPLNLTRAARVESAPPRRGRSQLRLDRLLFLVAIGAVGLVLLGWLIRQVVGRSSQPANASPAALQSMQEAMSDVIQQQEGTLSATAPLTVETAPQIIQKWLSAKEAAMGESHDIGQLSNILVDPALSEQQTKAEDLKAAEAHENYQHSDLTVTSVEVDPNDADRAQVEASVQEKGESFIQGRLDEASSYTTTLRVRYDLVRQDGQWKIENWQVLE